MIKTPLIERNQRIRQTKQNYYIIQKVGNISTSSEAIFNSDVYYMPKVNSTPTSISRADSELAGSHSPITILHPKKN